MALNNNKKPPSSNAGNTNDLLTIKTPAYKKDEAALTADAMPAMVELDATLLRQKISVLPLFS